MRKSPAPEQINALLGKGLPSAVKPMNTDSFGFLKEVDWIPDRVKAGYLPYFVAGPLNSETIGTPKGFKALITVPIHVGAWIVCAVADHRAIDEVWDSGYDTTTNLCHADKSATCHAIRMWNISLVAQWVAFGTLLAVTVLHFFSICWSNSFSQYFYLRPGKTSPIILASIITPLKIAVVFSILGLIQIDPVDIDSGGGRRLQLQTLEYGAFVGWALVALISKMSVLVLLEENTSAALNWYSPSIDDVRIPVDRIPVDRVRI